jgi:hypothetical protein
MIKDHVSFGKAYCHKCNYFNYGRDKSDPGTSCHTHQFLDMDVMNVPQLTVPNAMQQFNRNGKPVFKVSYLYFKTGNCFSEFHHEVN